MSSLTAYITAGLWEQDIQSPASLVMEALKVFAVVGLMALAAEAGHFGEGGGDLSSGYGVPVDSYSGGHGGGGDFGEGHGGGGDFGGGHGGGHGGGAGYGHGGGYEQPKPYGFGYAVHDQHTGTAFKQQEHSDGNTVKGQYRVQLPDGRTQIVTYTADWKTGYHADVKYEGEAVHPSNYGHGGHNSGSGGYGASSGGYGASSGGYGAESSDYGSHGGSSSAYNNIGAGSGGHYEAPSTGYGVPGYHK